MRSDLYDGIKYGFGKTTEFLKTKKAQKIFVVIGILLIILLGVFIRIQNLDLLKDQTTGEKIPLALDPYYFLRVAETMDQPGKMPECDSLRVVYDQECKGWTPEILPHSSIMIQKIGDVFYEGFTLNYAHIINPVIFFVLGIFVYFLLVSKLTKSRTIGLIASLFLTITPMYLYRTMAGFADHESIGMSAFFLLLLGFAVSLKYLDKNSGKINKEELTKKCLGGVLVGFLMALTIATWGGLARFSFMVVPLAVLIFWFVKRKSTNSLKILGVIPLFYALIISSSLVFTPLISGRIISTTISKYMLSSTGLISVVVLGFLIIDYLMIYLRKRKMLKIQEKYEILTSFAILFILGLILLTVMGELSIIGQVFEKILDPFGTGRVGETVAENRSPSLSNWMNQTGEEFFWLFVLGIIFVCNEISKKISGIKKRRNAFFGLSVLMFLGIIFSSHTLFSGSEIMKKFVYFAPVILFLGYSVWLYSKEKSDSFYIETGWIITFSWLIFMLIAARGAVRLFFVITPVVCFVGSIVPVKLYNIARKNKDELVKIFMWIALIAVIFGLIISGLEFYQSSMMQASNTGPSANDQWQEAMKWVRENTDESSVFLHWWDYGYWLQTLGKRATIVDGGFHPPYRVHLIGRYVLTTQNPDSALSFIKSTNSTHLLIDSSDIGKYSAYSRIGSGKEMKDRLSYIPTMKREEKLTEETNEGAIYTYNLGVQLDEDIVWENNETKYRFAKENSGILSIRVEKKQGEFQQPIAVFVKNEQKFNVPLKYLYVDSLREFEEGLEAGVFLMDYLENSNKGLSMAEKGAGFYLSPRTINSFVVRNYLFGEEQNLKIAHKEPNTILKNLESQGMNLGDFAQFGGQFLGPIKVWEAKDIPEEIIAHKEFTYTSSKRDDWEFGMLDELEFRE